MALASLTHWVHNLVVSKATPVMLYSTPYGAYFIFGAFNLVMGIGGFLVPETKGVSFLRLSLTNLSPVSILRLEEKKLTSHDRSLWSAWTKCLAARTFPGSRILVSQRSGRRRWTMMRTGNPRYEVG